MSKPNPPRISLPIPSNLSPTATRSFCLTLPDDPEWYSAFWGAFFYLTQWRWYEHEPTHKATEVAKIWKQYYIAARASWDALEDCTVNDWSIRLKPTDCTIIQQYNPIVGEWQDKIDLSCAVDVILTKDFPPTNPPGRSQPGEQPGGGSPAPGQCFDLDLTVHATTPQIIPIAIASGWTITVSNPEGIWNDGVFAPAHWFCYDGHQYALGSCTPFTISDPTDPLTSVPHMALLLKLPDGTYAQLVAGTPYVVPDGQPSGDYYLLPNDGALGDNGGDITLHVQACNTSDVVGLTYTHGGHGPTAATLNVEFTFTITSVGSPRPWASGEIYFSRCVTLEFVTVTGWSSDPDDPSNYAFRDCTGTWGAGVSGHPANGHSEPMINAYGQNSGTDMTIVAKITAIS